MIDPAALRPSYRAFLRPGRVLLTGHSHQAWPDVARDGLVLAFDDAAELVDEKWERAFAAAEAVREGVAARIGARAEDIALGASTHELVTRFLSALDLRTRPHLVTTTGEFHSLHRQLSRLAEARVEITFVDALPVATLAERVSCALRPTTAAVLVSTVLFETASIVPGVAEITRAAQRVGAEVLFDAYHAFGVVPFAVADLGPDPLWVTAGGYKYAQWGEGCCFLRVPPDTTLRPVYTGWFADFAYLTAPRDGRAIGYGPRGADRFAGSTYDPASHYRAREVIAFFERESLTVPRLRELSLHQTGRLLAGLDGFDVLTPRAPAERAGFIALRVANAGDLVRRLRGRGIWTDARGDTLRLGPAPYLTDPDLDLALSTLREFR